MLDQANELRKLVRDSGYADGALPSHKKHAGDLFWRISRQIKEAVKALLKKISGSKAVVGNADDSTSATPLLNLYRSEKDYQELIQL